MTEEAEEKSLSGFLTPEQEAGLGAVARGGPGGVAAWAAGRLEPRVTVRMKQAGPSIPRVTQTIVPPETGYGPPSVKTNVAPRFDMGRKPTMGEGYVPPMDPGVGGGGGGGYAVPGQWHPSEFEQKVEGATPLSPEVRRAYEEGYALQSRGLQGQQAGERGGAVADALGLQAKAEADKLASDQLQRLHASRDAVVGQTRQLVEDLSGEIRDAKVDGNRYWKDSSIGDKVRMGVGALLAGIGAGLAGQPLSNRVLDLIERRNEMDAREQVRQVQEKKGYRDQLVNSMDGLMKLFGGEEQAILANKALKYTALEAEVAKYRLGAKSALARAQYDSLLGGLALRRAKTLQDLEQVTRGKVSESFEQKYAKPHVVGGGTAAKTAPDPGGEVTAETLRWFTEQHKSHGLPEVEAATAALARASGLSDSSGLVRLAQSHPGHFTTVMAEAFKKNPQQVQAAAQALSIMTKKMSGQSLTATELGQATKAFNAASPEGRAETLRFLLEQYKIAEGNIASAHPKGYQLWARNKETYGKNFRPTLGGGPGAEVKEPGGSP